MKEIISSRIVVTNKLSINHILEVFLIAKHYEGKIYLHSNYHTLEVNRLPKLVSFFATLEPNSIIHIIVEGNAVHNQIHKLENAITRHRKKSNPPSKKVLIAKKTIHL